MRRSISWLCCVLSNVSPLLAMGSTAAHAHEHHTAVTGAGHEHDNSHIPHHKHDGDGDPIPLAACLTMCSALPAAPDGGPTWSFLPVAFVTPCQGETMLAAFQNGRCIYDRRSRSPTAPAPGDRLPLLI